MQLDRAGTRAAGPSPPDPGDKENRPQAKDHRADKNTGLNTELGSARLPIFLSAAKSALRRVTAWPALTIRAVHSAFAMISMA